MVEVRTDYAGLFADEIGSTCRGVFRGEGTVGSTWPDLSNDCTYDDGGYRKSRSTYDVVGCESSFDDYSERSGSINEGRGTYVCDSQGQWLSGAESWGGTDADGREWFIGYETTYENEYDAALRLVAQESVEVDDGGNEWWSREEWTYEEDWLVRWDRDLDGEPGTSWAWTSRIDYEWSAAGLLAAERAWWSEGHGETSVYWYRSHEYDDLGREVLQALDYDENGSIDLRYTWTYIGETTRIDTWMYDAYADGVDDMSKRVIYDCPGG